jgi:hypothetical protein
MIAFVLAAAVTATDLQARIEADLPFASYAESKATDERFEPSLDRHAIRENHCLRAKEAVRLTATIQSWLDEGEVRLVSERFVAHKLNGEDAKAVTAVLHKYETEAKLQQMDCQD